jgi:hypothetical protein
MRKLEALKVGEVQREGKKKVSCELKSFFSSCYFFITRLHLHFKDDF